MFYTPPSSKRCPPTLPGVSFPKTTFSPRFPRTTLPSLTGFESEVDALEWTSSYFFGWKNCLTMDLLTGMVQDCMRVDQRHFAKLQSKFESLNFTESTLNVILWVKVFCRHENDDFWREKTHSWVFLSSALYMLNWSFTDFWRGKERNRLIGLFLI